MEIRSSIITPSNVAAPQPGAAMAARSRVIAEDSNAPRDEVAATEGEESQQAATVASGVIELSAEEQLELHLLKQRDQEVRAHEQAHVAAGGHYVIAPPGYDYTSGPDGRRYAVGGEVMIDTSKIAGDPSATIEKARTILRAALAPADPSAQDQRVAAAARRMEMDAQRERLEEMLLAGQKVNEASGEEARRSPTSDARQGLAARIAAFFADSVSHRFDRYA